MLWRNPSMAKASSALPICSIACEPLRRMGDKLGDHRVVIDRDLAPLLHAGIEPRGDTAFGPELGRPIAHQPPRRGQEVPLGVLGINAHLDGRALQFHVLLLEGEFLAGGDVQHLLDQIEPGDELGDGMLDLKPRVHLEEIEIAVLVDDELDGAGQVVADGLGERDGLRSHRLARLGVEERARRLLHDLLIAPLDRAFALAEMNDVAVLVAEHLDLDMARLLDIFLDEHAIVAEARLGLAPRRGEALGDLLGAIGDAHALAAAAGGGLDHDRIADLLGDLDRLLGVSRSRRDGRARSRPWPWRRASSNSILSPIASMAFTFGPTNTMPAFSSARANAAFSERNP